jgi:phosphoglycerate dehydrogenase-like enzyme
MTRPTILLWAAEAGVYRQAIERAGLGDRVEMVEIRPDQRPDVATMARADALLGLRIPPGALTEMPRLRWVQALTAGVDEWLARPDLKPDVALTCARGTHRVQMPENILAALFQLTKPIVAAALDQRESKWTRRVSEPLAGKTLGILGLGTIGQELARKAAALEITVIGTRRTAGELPHVERVYPSEGTDEVLARSDFVLLLLPLTPATRDIMDATRLAKMKPSAHLLNFARGGLIVDDALVDAVNRRVIAGALLDVFRQEPLPPGHAFWTTPGITVWPHVGGLHPRRDELVAPVLVDNVARFLDGRSFNALVDRAAGY